MIVLINQVARAGQGKIVRRTSRKYGWRGARIKHIQIEKTLSNFKTLSDFKVRARFLNLKKNKC